VIFVEVFEFLNQNWIEMTRLRELSCPDSQGLNSLSTFSEYFLADWKAVGLY